MQNAVEDGRRLSPSQDPPVVLTMCATNVCNERAAVAYKLENEDTIESVLILHAVDNIAP